MGHMKKHREISALYLEKEFRTMIEEYAKYVCSLQSMFLTVNDLTITGVFSFLLLYEYSLSEILYYIHTTDRSPHYQLCVLYSRPKKARCIVHVARSRWILTEHTTV